MTNLIDISTITCTYVISLHTVHTEIFEVFMDFMISLSSKKLAKSAYLSFFLTAFFLAIVQLINQALLKFLCPVTLVGYL